MTTSTTPDRLPAEKSILHIIVRHKDHSNPKYHNQWLDDYRIKSIVTYKEIADLCRALIGVDALVRIHRTAFQGSPAIVSCEAHVMAVRPSGHLYEVEFTGCRALSIRPSFRPDGSKSYYFAEAEERGLCQPTYRETDSSDLPEKPLGDSVAIHSLPSPEQASLRETSRTDTPSVVTGGASPNQVAILLRGLDAWNFARRSKPDVWPRLRGIDLRPILNHILGYSEADFSKADLRNADLSGLTLRRPNFAGVKLRSANLAGSTWDAASSEALSRYATCYANFQDSDLSGADLANVTLHCACVHGADFRDANLATDTFENATLRGLRFDGADLRDAKFRRCDLTDSTFEGADLRGVDLSTAVISRSQLSAAITDENTKLPVDWSFG